MIEETTAALSGTRIKYIREGNIMISCKVYSNGHKMVRVIIDVDKMEYKFVDPVTGIVLKTSEKKVTNLEVLMRHVKKGLIAFLGVKFGKESRNVGE